MDPGSSQPEFAGAEKCLREAADLGEKTGKARLLNILSFFGSCDSPPQDLTTVDGASIWAGDGVHRADRCARQEKRRGGWAAAYVAAQTRPAADPALALWPAPAVPAGARIRPPQQQPEGRWADARQCARRQPRSRPGAERAAQGRSTRPLGSLVKVSERSFKKRS